MQHCLFANSPRGKDLINLLSLLLERSQTFRMGNLVAGISVFCNGAGGAAPDRWGGCSAHSEVQASWEERRGMRKREQLCWGLPSRRGLQHPQTKAQSRACVSGTGIRLREDAAGGGGFRRPIACPCNPANSVVLEDEGQLCCVKLP